MSHSLYHASVRPFPSMPRPSARPNYVVRRLVAVIVVAVVVVAAVAILTLLMVLLAGLGGRPASASRAEPAHLSTATFAATVVAEPGDSLWSIAIEHNGTVPLDSYLDTLIDINGGSAIQAGQSVHLP